MRMAAVVLGVTGMSVRGETARWDDSTWDSTWGSLQTTDPEDQVCALIRVNRKTATSDQCLDCHDGSIADATEFWMPDEEAPLVIQSNSHPISISYLDSPNYGEIGGLRIAEELPLALVFPNGNVECTTCHEHHDAPFDLAVPIARSQLCLACHDK